MDGQRMGWSASTGVRREVVPKSGFDPASTWRVPLGFPDGPEVRIHHAGACLAEAALNLCLPVFLF